MASASFASRRPVSRWVRAAAFLIRITASTKAASGRRLEIGKFCRARSVCMPHSASVGKIGKSTRLNSSHGYISYAVFCLKKKKKKQNITNTSHSYKQDHQT